VTDRIPPKKEFHRYSRDALYGHPFIVGNGMPRPEYAAREDVWSSPQTNFAVGDGRALGAQWPERSHRRTQSTKKGDAFIACHGSWNGLNRSYRVS